MLNTLPVLQRLGWVLVHFLWEGALVALVLAVVLHALEGRSAAERYGASLAALLALVVLPVVTWFYVPASEASPVSEASRAPAGPGPAAGGFAPGPLPEAPVLPTVAPSADFSPAGMLAEIADLLAPGLPWLAAVWMLGVAALSLRAVGGWVLAQQLRRRGTEPAGEAWTQAFERLARRLGVRRPARLLRSACAASPMTIGWWRPVVLMPGSVLTGLPPEQVEAILAHELAHIRRYDYLVGLLQTAIETLLFYHPAVWWVSDQVRQEREHCCDDLAVAACRGDRLTYAQALAGLAGLRAAPSFAMGAAGGSLLARIQRIATGEAPKGARRPVLLLTVLLVVMGAVAAQAVRPAVPGPPLEPLRAPMARSFAAPFTLDVPFAPFTSAAPFAPAAPPAPLPPDTTHPDSAGGSDVRIYFRDGDSSRVRVLPSDAPRLNAWSRQMDAWGDSLGRALADSLEIHFSDDKLDALTRRLEESAENFALRFERDFESAWGDSLRSFSFSFSEENGKELEAMAERLAEQAEQWAAVWNDSLNENRFTVQVPSFPHSAVPPGAMNADAWEAEQEALEVRQEALEAEQEALERAAERLEDEADALRDEAEALREQGGGEAARRLEQQSRVMEQESRRLEQQSRAAKQESRQLEQRARQLERQQEQTDRARERAEEERARQQERLEERLQRLREKRRP